MSTMNESMQLDIAEMKACPKLNISAETKQVFAAGHVRDCCLVPKLVALLNYLQIRLRKACLAACAAGLQDMIHNSLVPASH
jgi:hypothetical protein